MDAQTRKANTGSDWYQSQDALLAELQRGLRPAEPREAVIRGYVDLRELRRGGQGVVYTATQLSTKRRVAIKVLLETGRSNADTRRRFEREIDIVAALNHPNIVRVFDSGVTGDGRLFCVMEFIDGASLDELLLGGRDALGGIDSVLRLFVRICDAVQFAHQRGVIHRDLKPSNVRIDPSGEPHVLDFGLAKSIDDAGEAATQMSMTGQFMGSLPWASPEQAEGHPDRLDVRTDVYSLGVMLYQILAGAFPYEVNDTLPRVLENIRSTPPRSLRSLRPEVDEELSTIVLKCLSKEPERRYQSAGELARDLRHYLAGEPIEAKRDSAWYTVRKTMARYQTALRVALVVMVASVGATIWMAMLWRRAVVAEHLAADRLESVQAAVAAEKKAHEATIAEAKKARDTVVFLDTTLRFVDPWKHPGRDITPMREMLDAARQRLDTAFADQPDVQAALLQTLGTNYWTLGVFESAEASLRRAVELFRKTKGDDDAATLAAEFDLASALTDIGKHDESEAILRRVLDARCRLFGPDDVQTFNTINNLAYDIDWQGRVPEAAKLYREAYEGLKRTIGPYAVDATHAANNLAIALQTLGEAAESERLFLEVIEGRTLMLGANHPETLMARMNLAKMVGDQGRLAESLQLMQRVLDDMEAVLPEGHPTALTAKANLADLLAHLGHAEDALRINQEVYEAQVTFGGEQSPQALARLNQVMCSLIELKRYDEALPLGRDLRERLIRVVGPADLRTLVMSGNLAFVLNSTGHGDEAVAIWKDIIAQADATLGPNSQPAIVAHTNLAGYFADAERWADAERHYQAAISSYEALQQATGWRAAVSICGLGRVCTETGRYADAENNLRSALAIMHETFGDEHERTQRVLHLLVRLYERVGDSAKLAEVRARVTPASQPSAAN